MEIVEAPHPQELKLIIHTSSALFHGRIQRALAEETGLTAAIETVPPDGAVPPDDPRVPSVHLLDCSLDAEVVDRHLRYARQGAPSRSFICVGSSIGEEAAADLVLRGASAFVHIDNLARLPQVLQGVLRSAHAGPPGDDPEARMKSLVDFFTNVSHELRTPLSLILLQMDKMRANVGNPQRLHQAIESVTVNSYRLTRLVNNLLDITKMEGGFMTLNLRSRDIVSELRAICESVQDYAAIRGIKLHFVSDINSLFIDLDRDKLDRIVLNLLSNAIKHTGDGGAITLGLQSLRDIVRIRVADTGDGIPEDQLEAIFDRFSQASNARSGSGEGCGIGLALVRSLTELHRGRIWVQSKPGGGSTFTVELPTTISDIKKTSLHIESYELNRKVDMELSDLQTPGVSP